MNQLGFIFLSLDPLVPGGSPILIFSKQDVSQQTLLDHWTKKQTNYNNNNNSKKPKNTPETNIHFDTSSIWEACCFIPHQTYSLATKHTVHSTHINNRVFRRNQLTTAKNSCVIYIYIYCQQMKYVYICNGICVYIYGMEYDSAIKKNVIILFAATWMDLEMITLSEVCPTVKNIYPMI